METMGIRPTIELLNRSLGLSLSDQYWGKPHGSDLHWEDVNFFDNPFDEDLGKLLLTTYSSSRKLSFNASQTRSEPQSNTDDLKQRDSGRGSRV